ncbi:molybdopterin converting factor subunit 1 [Thiobacillus sp.]|uniref:molybdopterin converting factor subunit 1 n=1 Tax=Thiobacillus sp. TaxID=924 RepID=UPI0025DB91B9|nr:molybdopterin converting factor subunit 1 [Thiobacillus sp.]
MKLRVLYFARLRERFGVAEEAMDFSGATAADLVAHLQSRGDAWAEELAPGRAFRVAVNQNLVALDAGLPEHAEVAIFPPVTGG